jgi:hypothetical protein
VRKLAKVGVVGAAALLTLGGISIGVANATTSGPSGASADPSASPSASGSAPAGDSGSKTTTPAGCRITVLTDPVLSAGRVTARTEIHCPSPVRTLAVSEINLVDEATGKIVAYSYSTTAKSDHVGAEVALSCQNEKPTKYRVEVFGFSNEDNIAFGYALEGRSKNCPTLNCGA